MVFSLITGELPVGITRDPYLLTEEHLVQLISELKMSALIKQPYHTGPVLHSPGLNVSVPQDHGHSCISEP